MWEKTRVSEGHGHHFWAFHQPHACKTHRFRSRARYLKVLSLNIKNRFLLFPGDDFWCMCARADQNNTPRGLMHLRRSSAVTPWHQRRLTNTSQLGLTFDESALTYGQVMIGTIPGGAHVFFLLEPIPFATCILYIKYLSVNIRQMD